MMNSRRVAAAAMLATAALVGCSGGGKPVGSDAAFTDVERFAREAAPGTVWAVPEPRRSWQKARYISVDEAVARLQRRIDFPVVLPRDRSAGLPNFKGWLADPKYLEWARAYGRRTGHLKLRKGRRILLVSYGAATFDGCGGREHAIPTDVLGQPALLTIAARHRWSHIIWPVTDSGSTGRYGLAGGFEGWQMVRLAESMERARLEAAEGRRGCL